MIGHNGAGRRDHLFTINVVQTCAPEGDGAAGLAAAVRATPRDIDLVVLPYLGAAPWFLGELDRSGYQYAERAPAATLATVQEAAKARGVAAAVTFYEVVAEGVFYATVALVDAAGEVRGAYRQAHAVNQPGWHEQLFFQPGTTGAFPVFETGSARVGFLLGGDLMVPEASRMLALNGAEIIVAITAMPATAVRNAVALARARAIENGRPFVLASRADHDLAGMSIAFDAEGAMVAESWRDDPALLVALDLDAARAFRRRFDPLRLRRGRLYHRLAQAEEGPL